MEHALIQSVLILFALLTTAKGAVDFAHDTARRLCLFGSLLMLLVAAGEVLDVVHFVGVYVYVYVYVYLLLCVNVSGEEARVDAKAIVEMSANLFVITLPKAGDVISFASLYYSPAPGCKLHWVLSL